MRLLRSAVAGALLTGSVAEYFPNIPTVDLGYAVYTGSHNATSNINVFQGIRYAAPPLGKLRWAAPQTPAKNSTATIPALSDPPGCPQTGAGSATPNNYGFTSALGNEDCLFLNVYAPANATNLPVFFWIHGGGHNLFSIAGLDPTEIMKQNKNGFVSVIIQYRLGAFGFLGGKDVKKDGVLNAGLLDQNFALKWVQAHIAKFGGDPSKVTIAGESSGGACVLYQAMAYGGKQKEDLFNNVITASPWFPGQYRYNAHDIEERYKEFVQRAGCSRTDDKLACLRSQDTDTLQRASQKVSELSPFGTFAFVPVTDGSFITERPSAQLFSSAVKGKRVLSGNMANEGIPLAPPTAKTLEDFRSYLDITFPQFIPDDKVAVEKAYAYAGDTLPTDPNAPLYATDGLSGSSAVNQSGYATGQSQRVINLFAEYAFICPGYWAAAAFPQGWKYQVSVPPAYHGYDLEALWSATPSPSASFKHAFRAIWGNFIMHDSPVISISDAKGLVQNSSVRYFAGERIAWNRWDERSPYLLNINATGGSPTSVASGPFLEYEIFKDPGGTTMIDLVDAEKWEGGRGARCAFWKSVADRVPY